MSFSGFLPGSNENTSNVPTKKAGISKITIINSPIMVQIVTYCLIVLLFQGFVDFFLGHVYPFGNIAESKNSPVLGDLFQDFSFAVFYWWRPN